MDGADTDDLIYMVLNYITIYLSVRIKMYEYKLLLAIKIFFPVLNPCFVFTSHGHAVPCLY